MRIAIDGPSSSGKSTLAREVAQALHFRYIDSGAYYRAFTWHLMANGINWSDERSVEKALQNIHMEFLYDSETGQCRMMLNGVDVENRIRTPQVSQAASEVSALPAVRRFITEELRRAAAGGGVVMDGRDIGTVVLPDADVKIFMTADERVRLQRRLKQLKQQGVTTDETDLASEMRQRDRQDSARALAPLRKAPDAIELDNSNMTYEQQRRFVLRLARKALRKTPSP